MICIALIGLLHTIKELEYPIYANLPYWQIFLTFVFHASFLLILINFKREGYFNIASLFLMFLGIFIIYYLPWWPYIGGTRLEFIYQLIVINLSLYCLHYLLYAF